MTGNPFLVVSFFLWVAGATTIAGTGSMLVRFRFSGFQRIYSVVLVVASLQGIGVLDSLLFANTRPLAVLFSLVLGFTAIELHSRLERSILTRLAYSPKLRAFERGDRARLGTQMRAGGNTSGHVSLALTLLVVAGLEELLYRQLFITALNLMLHSFVWAAFVSIIVFALAHVFFGWDQVLVKGLMGALLLASTIASDSVVGAAAAHMFYNWRVWRTTDLDSVPMRPHESR